MRHPLLPLALIVLALAGAGPAAAQSIETYSVDVGLLAGRGGSFDVNPDAGLSNPAFIAFANLVTDRFTLVGLRVGRFEFDDEAGFGGLADATVDFAAVVGEYRVPKGYYDVGLFLGLGGYRVEGEGAGGEATSETSLGALFGVTGELRIWRNLFLAGEISGHYAFLDRANLFGAAMVGIGVRF